MTTFESLPNELLHHLFLFLDGVALVKASLVSRRWKNVTQNILQNPYFWRRRCFSDIPAIIKEELTLNEPPEEGSGDLHYDWRAVYSSWYRRRFLGRWPSLVGDVKGIEEFVKSLGRISQVAFFDDFLLTTHRNANCGLVKLWDTIQGEMLATISRHPPPQRDLHLCLIVPCRFRLPFCEEGKKESTRGRNEFAEILVVSASAEVKVDLVCPATRDIRSVFTHRYSSCPTVAATSWADSHFAAAAEDGKGAIYRFNSSATNSFQGQLISSFLCPFRTIESICLWRDLLVTGSGDGTVAVWRLSEPERDDPLQQEQQREHPPPRQLQQAPMRLRLRHDVDDEAKEMVLTLTYRTRSLITDVILRGELVIFLDEAGVLTILSDLAESGARQINLFGLIQSRPSCVRLSSSFLAIGDEAGKVTLFDVSCPRSPIHLNAFRSSSSSPSFASSSSSSSPYVFHSSSRERVREIVISDDGHGPTMIVLSGKSTVQTVRFFHPDI